VEPKELTVTSAAEMFRVRAESPVVTVRIRSAVRLEPGLTIRSWDESVSNICRPVLGIVISVVTVPVPMLAVADVRVVPSYVRLAALSPMVLRAVLYTILLAVVVAG
jgi:hypothetical protein